MQDSLTREKILKKIRAALIEKTPHPFPNVDVDSRITNVPEMEREIVFAESFTKQGGYFLFCENHLDFIENFLGLCEAKKWQQFYCLDKSISSFLNDVEFPHFNINDHSKQKPEVVISTCEALVARTGTIVLSSKLAAGKILISKADTLIVLANVEQLVDDIKDAMQLIKLKYNKNFPSEVSMLSGPFNDSEISAPQNTDNRKKIFLFLIENNDMINRE